MKYGSRHPKRAVETDLRQPASNPIGTEQIVSRVDQVDSDTNGLLLDDRTRMQVESKIGTDVLPHYMPERIAGLMLIQEAASRMITYEQGWM
jgi:hypothetical protein